VPGREVGDVVQADVVDVQHGVDQGADAQRVGGGEVLEGPLDREAQRPEREQDGQVSPAAGERQQAEHGECARDEPAAAERADGHDHHIHRREVRLHPAMDRLHDVQHEPLLGGGVHRRALEHHQPEERRQRDDREQEGAGGAGDGTAQSVGGAVAHDEAPHGIGQPSHAA